MDGGLVDIGTLVVSVEVIFHFVATGDWCAGEVTKREVVAQGVLFIFKNLVRAERRGNYCRGRSAN